VSRFFIYILKTHQFQKSQETSIEHFFITLNNAALLDFTKQENAVFYQNLTN